MKRLFASAATAALLIGGATAASADSACLITKTDTNPFFVKMKEGATAKAAELGIELKSYAGKIDGDHESQVAARSEEHTSELQSRENLVCRLLLEKKKKSEEHN